jgi:cellulose synthase/poly-beta-1,6-N-acetylglucosamine synthase-like glycosyltransferase
LRSDPWTRTEGQASPPDERASSITFSIVMPAYNTEQTIEAAILSVLSQTRADFELIVADDGSTDDTPTRIERFLEDKRVRLIRGNHRGPSAARNAAIAEAVGEYICFLDSDDLWLPSYLESMSAMLSDAPRVAVAFTDAWVLFDAAKLIARRTAMEELRPSSIPQNPEGFLRAMLEHSNFVYYSTMVRRAVLDEVGRFDERFRGPEDYELWLRIAAHGYSFAWCPEPQAIYRRRAGQLTADPSTINRALADVFRTVVEEYEVDEELKQLASRQVARHSERGQPSPVSRWRQVAASVLGRPYRVVSRYRWFFRRPPAVVRKAFPNLDEV